MKQRTRRSYISSLYCAVGTTVGSAEARWGWRGGGWGWGWGGFGVGLGTGLYRRAYYGGYYPRYRYAGYYPYRRAYYQY